MGDVLAHSKFKFGSVRKRLYAALGSVERKIIGMKSAVRFMTTQNTESNKDFH